MGSRGAYGGYTALLSQAASLYWVLELLVCAGRGRIFSTTPLNRAFSLRPLPFLSCKFFALQKTYEIRVTGLLAGRHLALAKRRFFPQYPRLLFRSVKLLNKEPVVPALQRRTSAPFRNFNAGLRDCRRRSLLRVLQTFY
jgi:predicted dienelactone hydrolase